MISLLFLRFWIGFSVNGGFSLIIENIYSNVFEKRYVYFTYLTHLDPLQRNGKSQRPSKTESRHQRGFSVRLITKERKRRGEVETDKGGTPPMPLT